MPLTAAVHRVRPVIVSCRLIWPVLSGPAVTNIAGSVIREVVVTNTIPLSEEAKQEPKIRVLSIAGLIGRAIQANHEETSVSKLFI